jgi:baseplate J-like protein
MSQRYQCASQLRRNAVLQKLGWNGIDYLEFDPTTNVNAPLILRVVFLKPDNLAALTDKNFRIEGGIRYRNPPIDWAVQNPGGGNVVQVAMKTPVLTDFSTYTLRVVGPVDSAPPANFDPQLAQVEFSFKVGCPSPFDCRKPNPPGPPPVPDPDLDYGARDWQSFRRLMLDRVSALVPGFKEDTPVDFLTTQVEALAYLADHLSYKLDAVSTEQTLWTARSRVSLARHARLLDYPVHEGANARVFAQFRYQPTGAAPATVVLPQGTVLTPQTGGSLPVMAPDDFAKLVPANPVVFETMHAIELREAHNEIDFHTWSDDLCTLPHNATRATLKKGVTALKAGDFLLLRESTSPVTGLEGDADRTRRHVVRLTSVAPLRDDIEAVDVVDVQWSADDALPFDLVIAANIRENGQPDKRVVCAKAAANTALADHGLTLPPAGVTPSAASALTPALMPPAAPESGEWRPRLSRSELIHAAPVDLSLDGSGAPRVSAKAAMANDPAQAFPALELRDSFAAWRTRQSLLASERFDRDVVIETEHDGTVSLRFGDNVLGVKPAPGSQLQVKARFGRHLDGNIGADVLRKVVTPLPGITAVANPLEASGGTPPLAPTVIRVEAPYAFRKQERAVTEDDYAEMAERHPDVSRAVARVRWTGAWRTAFVYIDRKGGVPVDQDFVDELTQHMERYRLAGVDLALRGALPVALDIALRICVQPGAQRADVQRRVLERLGTGTLADARAAFFNQDRFTFGSPLYLSELVAAVMEVAGVASVEPLTFQRWAIAPDGELGRGAILAGEFEVLRLDNDPSFPENGRLSLEMLGGV